MGTPENSLLTKVVSFQRRRFSYCPEQLVGCTPQIPQILSVVFWSWRRGAAVGPDWSVGVFDPSGLLSNPRDSVAVDERCSWGWRQTDTWTSKIKLVLSVLKGVNYVSVPC